MLRAVSITLFSLLLVSGGPVVGASADAPSARASRWSWPVVSHRIVRGYEEPVGPYGAGHRGVDLLAVPGEAVHAAADGEVVFAGTVAGRGVLAIGHPGGFRSSIEPVRATVVSGAPVRAGDVVGIVEGSSHCGASCVHFGVRRDGRYVPPEFLLGPPPRPVLVPL